MRVYIVLGQLPDNVSGTDVLRIYSKKEDAELFSKLDRGWHAILIKEIDQYPPEKPFDRS